MAPLRDSTGLKERSGRINKNTEEMRDTQQPEITKNDEQYEKMTAQFGAWNDDNELFPCKLCLL